MLRIVADENFPPTAIDALRQKGHDVLSVRESMRAAPDDLILKRAQKEHRIVATFDKDFGTLAYGWGLDARCGVILFRLVSRSPVLTFRRVLQVVESRSDWSGQFATATDARLRVRPLPARKKARKRRKQQ